MAHEYEHSFCKSIETLQFSSEDKKRLYQCVVQSRKNDTEKEHRNMKKLAWNKIAAIAAVCLMLVGGSAYAASRITYYQASSRADYDFHTVSEMASAQQKAQGNQESPMPEPPEVFANGFAFDGGNVVHKEGVDEAGNTVGSWEDYHGHYKDGSGRDISVTMSLNAYGESQRNATEERTIEGISVRYNHDEYLFLPTEKDVLKEEEQAREATDEHFFVSYGSDERETKFYDGVSFEKDGIAYSIFTMDNASPDELFSMAEELIAR